MPKTYTLYYQRDIYHLFSKSRNYPCIFSATKYHHPSMIKASTEAILVTLLPTLKIFLPVEIKFWKTPSRITWKFSRQMSTAEFRSTYSPVPNNSPLPPPLINVCFFFVGLPPFLFGPPPPPPPALINFPDFFFADISEILKTNYSICETASSLVQTVLISC